MEQINEQLVLVVNEKKIYFCGKYDLMHCPLHSNSNGKTRNATPSIRSVITYNMFALSDQFAWLDPHAREAKIATEIFFLYNR